MGKKVEIIVEDAGEETEPNSVFVMARKVLQAGVGAVMLTQ